MINFSFDLSDVAFCILSRYNQSLVHFTREYSCSCKIHYFNLNQNYSIEKYQTNRLRLTPICQENGTEMIGEEYSKENHLILQDLENQCDYQLIFLDCDAMTTTTTTEPITTIISSESMENDADTSMEFIVENISPSTTSRLGGNECEVICS